MNKNKIILISLLIFIILAIALIFKNTGSNETDSYYYKINTERFNYLLNTSINSLEQLQRSLKDKNNSSLDSFSEQLSDCIVNLRETAIAIDCFEAGLNRKDNKIMYGLNPLESQFVDYSDVLANQTKLETLIVELDKIIDDLKAIQEAKIFTENKYEEIKSRWNLVIEKLYFKPTIGL